MSRNAGPLRGHAKTDEHGRPRAYCLTPVQRHIVLALCDSRQPMTLDALIVRIGANYGDAGRARARIKRTIDETLMPDFVVMGDPVPDGATYVLTTRAEEIAINIQASSVQSGNRP